MLRQWKIVSMKSNPRTGNLGWARENTLEIRSNGGTSSNEDEVKTSCSSFTFLTPVSVHNVEVEETSLSGFISAGETTSFFVAYLLRRSCSSKQ